MWRVRRRRSTSVCYCGARHLTYVLKVSLSSRHVAVKSLLYTLQCRSRARLSYPCMLYIRLKFLHHSFFGIWGLLFLEYLCCFYYSNPSSNFRIFNAVSCLWCVKICHWRCYYFRREKITWTVRLRELFDCHFINANYPPTSFLDCLRSLLRDSNAKLYSKFSVR